jgi:hypothetical protein
VLLKLPQLSEPNAPSDVVMPADHAFVDVPKPENMPSKPPPERVLIVPVIGDVVVPEKYLTTGVMGLLSVELSTV